MPGRQLPTILSHDVRSRNTSKSCFVTVGTKVYDITSFLDDHPGGGDLILEYGGKDVTDIMGDEISHFHSEAAYEILDEHLIGFVATEKVMDAVTKSNRPDSIVPLPPDSNGLETMETLGLTGEENGKSNGSANGDTDGSAPGAFSSKPPDFAATAMSSAAAQSKDPPLVDDYKTHKFLDLNRPLFMQVWNGGFEKDFYLEQVHRPRHYKGGASAPLFGNFLEPLSKTAWWVVPMVWLPPVAYGTFLAFWNIPNTLQMMAYWSLGLFLWTLVEYILHRGLFHVDEWVHTRLVLFAFVLIVLQLPTQQPGSPHKPFPAPWDTSLSPHGQISACHASYALRRTSHSFLQAGSYCVLLGLVCCSRRFLWRYLWLHMLRLDPLLPSPQKVGCLSIPFFDFS